MEVRSIPSIDNSIYKRTDFINKLKQDHIEYRRLPDEKIDTAVIKSNNNYYANEQKIKHMLDIMA